MAKTKTSKAIQTSVDNILVSSRLNEFLISMVDQLEAGTIDDDVFEGLANRILSTEERVLLKTIDKDSAHALVAEKAALELEKIDLRHQNKLEEIATGQTSAEQKADATQRINEQRADLKASQTRLEQDFRIDMESVKQRGRQSLEKIRQDAVTGRQIDRQVAQQDIEAQRGTQTVEQIEARGAEQRRLIGARAGAKIAEFKGTKTAEAQVARTIRNLDPDLRQADQLLDQLRNQVDNDPSMDPRLFDLEVKKIQALDPQTAGQKAESLKGVVEGKVEIARVNALDRISDQIGGAAVPSDVQTRLQTLTKDRIQPLPDADLAPLVAQARNIQNLDAQLRRAGVTTVDGTIGGGPLDLPGLRGAGLERAQSQFEALKRGTAPIGGGAGEDIRRGLRNARGGRLGLAAVATPLILSLLGGGDEPDQSQNPAMQLQLAQQLNQIQQNQALSESLIQSRGATAAKNQAESDMIKLQMLQLLNGGGGGGGVI